MTIEETDEHFNERRLIQTVKDLVRALRTHISDECIHEGFNGNPEDYCPCLTDEVKKAEDLITEIERDAAITAAKAKPTHQLHRPLIDDEEEGFRLDLEDGEEDSRPKV